MDLELSRGELALLHCLRDGDDPYQVLHDADPVGFARDAARLVCLRLIESRGRHAALTLEGVRELDQPRNSGPMPLDDYDLSCRDWQIR